MDVIAVTGHGVVLSHFLFQERPEILAAMPIAFELRLHCIDNRLNTAIGWVEQRDFHPIDS